MTLVTGFCGPGSQKKQNIISYSMPAKMIDRQRVFVMCMLCSLTVGSSACVCRGTLASSSGSLRHCFQLLPAASASSLEENLLDRRTRRRFWWTNVHAFTSSAGEIAIKHALYMSVTQFVTHNNTVQSTMSTSHLPRYTHYFATRK